MRRAIRTSMLALAVLGFFMFPASSARADSPTHVVQPGENLFRIALHHGVSLDALRAANGIRGDLIYVGQVLVIPGAGGTDSTAAQLAASSGGVHVVQAGETLFRIGLNYGVPWTTLQSANGLSGTRIYTGQRLVIPGASPPANPPASPPPTAPQPSAPAASVPGSVHVVQPGETLFLIGLRYGITWPLIQAANGLSGTKVIVGQRLIIPGEARSSSAATSPTTAAPAGSGKRFLVDLSEQRLYAFEGDTLVRTTLVSTGLPDTPTVTGTFYIYLRYTSQRMTGRGYDLPNVPYVQYFYKGYGLHGTYWHSNFGRPMSRGCVNMPTEEAEWAYSWATYGTPVVVQP